MKDDNLFFEGELFYNLDNPPNTDPIVDTGEKVKTSSYTRTTTDDELKIIKKQNLSKKCTTNRFAYEPNSNTNDTSKRIITDIRPATQIVNYLPKTTARVIKNIQGINLITSSNADYAEKFMQKGSDMAKEIQDEEQKLNALNLCERWKLTQGTRTIMDFSAGLLKHLSQGQRFLSVEPSTISTPNNPQQIYKWILKITYPQIAKCTYGGLVDNKGSFQYGVLGILRNTTIKDMNDFINGKIAEPRLLYYNKNEYTNMQELCEYTPVHILTKHSNYAELEIDRRYFPLDFDNNGLPTGITQRYLTGIAGIASIIEIGHSILKHKYPNENLPNTLTALRYYHSLMGAFQFQSLLGMSLRNNFADKDNIRVKKDGIYQLLDNEYKELQFNTQLKKQEFIKEHRINSDILINPATANDIFPNEIRLLDKELELYKVKQWQPLQHKAMLIHEMIYEGLKTTNILTELQRSPDANNILIPSITTKMQYLQDEKYQNALLIKVEPVNKLKL